VINKKIYEFPIHYTSPLCKIAIGWGVHETVADECKAVNIKKALITTTGLRGTGIIDEINQILKTHGISTAIYDKVTSNPKDHEVMAAYKVFKEAQCDGVVSVGGGSSHDCGKGVRALAANDGKHISDFAAFIDPPWMEAIKQYHPATVPQIAVNTTAGTSAESTFAATITNTKIRAKQVIVVPGLMPTAGLIDPLFVRLMPQHIAAWTGFDALAHSFETALSKVQAPPTIAIVLRMMKIIAGNLREFTYNRMNHIACENMCWAEAMAGMALALGGGAGIVHGFGHQIGALTDCHHGLANAVLSLPLERYNEPAFPERFAEMASAMGVDTQGMTKTEAADRWFDEMEKLLSDMNIKTGHLNKQFGLKKEDLKHIVNIYSKDFCMEGNPRAFDFDECLKLLEDML
jgi:methanol:N,N-dimethyl-4-nitrosoaniline oxidoreductase